MGRALIQRDRVSARHPQRGAAHDAHQHPDSHSHGWGDNAWAPLTALLASVQRDLAAPERKLVPGTAPAPWVLRVGSEHRWTADPGGDSDPNEWWWWSRMATAIERLDDTELSALLAEHGIA